MREILCPDAANSVALRGPAATDGSCPDAIVAGRTTAGPGWLGARVSHCLRALKGSTLVVLHAWRWGEPGCRKGSSP